MKSFKRWAKRFAVSLVIFLGLLALVVFGGRAYLGHVGSLELTDATGKLDLAEPGWRLEAIEAERQRKAPPPEKNPAELVLKTYDAIPDDWKKWRNANVWFERKVGPRRLAPAVLAAAAEQKAPTEPARLQARSLRHHPGPGRYPLVWTDNPLTTLLPHVDKARTVVSLLEYDALVAASEGDFATAVLCAHAALNVGRSIGDEPTLISQLVRIACARVAATTLMQTLAWGEPVAGLPELQAALRAEADEPWFLYGIRGERGAINRLFESLESGKVSLDELFRLVGDDPNPLTRAGFVLYKGLLPGDHAECLRVLTEYHAAALLPPHQQSAALKAVRRPPRPPDDFRYVVTSLLVPATEKVAEAGLRTRAELLAADVLIACERFRRANGRWPNSPEELPKELLPAIPTDPFDGLPVRYRKLEDGVAVFSVGPEHWRENPDRRPRTDSELVSPWGVGWRLWDVPKRGQPAELEPKPDDGPAPLAPVKP